MAPDAKTDDGMLDLVIAETMPKLQMLAMVPRFMQGTHLKDRRVTSRKVEHVIVASEDPLYLHADGEILCDEAHRVEARVIPACLRTIARPSGVA